MPDTERAPRAIEITDLNVAFKVRAQRQQSLQHLVASGLRSRSTTEVRSLRGISLSIGLGEVVGLVGRNGAGKSTLLAAIAGLLPPSSGSVYVSSQPTLLGVGAALMPRLSGQRNITIGALAMGLQISEVDAVHAFVEEFTELGDALERPLNTYSSGMRARLAFALATYQMPQIMLIDEALAVGDRSFKAKSLARVRELQEHAGTIVMATHNLREIRQTCSRVVWLDGGKVVMDGPVKPVLRAYDPEDED